MMVRILSFNTGLCFSYLFMPLSSHSILIRRSPLRRSTAVKLRNNKEQFLKDNESLRCMSIRVLIQFLDRKIECDFAGSKRLADEDGRAIWATIDDTKGMKGAIQNRAQERLCEERNLWDDFAGLADSEFSGVVECSNEKGNGAYRIVGEGGRGEEYNGG